MKNYNQIKNLKNKILEYANKRGGYIYTPIMHEDFYDIPYQHGHERFNIIKQYIPKDAKTLLDIGAHWGYFSGRFEDLGLQVTAVENNTEYLYFLYEIKKMTNKKFMIFEDTIFNLKNLSYDIVVALNIFHHFIKKERTFILLSNFLNKINCNYMFFQAHNPSEGQMINSYKNFSNIEFVNYILDNSCLAKYKTIYNDKRPIYMLYK